MRERKGAALRVVLFFVALALPHSLRADELDTLLAQPPSASLKREDAAHRIEVLRALAATHPDRQTEIEAYLIPFVRATQPPAAEVAAAAEPPPAQPKPFLIIKGPDGKMTTMRAASYERQGHVILAFGADGNRAVLQALTIVGELPWYTDDELESGAVDLRDLAQRYASFVKVFPALRPVLLGEADRLDALRQAREAAVENKAKAEQARLAAVTSAVYDSAKDYTPEVLAKLLLDAEKVRSEVPGTAARIDAWAAPFREHFARLLGGQAFIDGAWVSKEELARQAQEKQRAAFLGSLEYEIGAEAISAGAAKALFLRPLVEAGIVLVAGVVLIFLGKRRKYLRVAGILLLALAPFAPARTFFLATRTPALLPASIAIADEQPLVDALSQAAGLDGNASEKKISEAALNEFLARHVRLASAPAGQNKAPERDAVLVRIQPDRIAVFEMVRSAGLNWIVRIDLAAAGGDDKAGFALAGAKIGALDCPAGMTAELWENLEPQFSKIIDASRLADRFSIGIPSAGVIELKPLEKPADGSASQP